ncbi:MAG: GDP-mannose 4,6-dehydratase, partial [Verrucomicrobiota bacterium]
ARDYVEMQWLMLQQERAEDFVIATGVQRSVREFVELAYGHLGRTLHWEGEGENERGFDTSSGDCVVQVDPRYFRPTEVETLLGDASRAREKLGWEPKISLEALIKEMMQSDVELAKRDALVKQHGYKAFDYNE